MVEFVVELVKSVKSGSNGGGGGSSDDPAPASCRASDLDTCWSRGFVISEPACGLDASVAAATEGDGAGDVDS
jgi:hypothetical protein